MNLKSLIIAGIFLSVTFSCKPTTKEQNTEKIETTPIVYVSNYPLQFFVERIADEAVNIKFPASESGDPAYWKPTGEQIAEMQQADLIFLNGASYEQWLENITLPETNLVNTTSTFKDKHIKYKEAVTHSHGPEGEHAHLGTAFTTWLDLSFASKQALAVLEALSKQYPKKKLTFETNYTALLADLQQLDKEFEKVLRNRKKVEVVFSHPVYQYFQKRYGIHGHSVHWEPDVEITKAMWHDLEHTMGNHKPGWMIWEGNPLESSVMSLEKIGIRSIVFNPCSNIPESGDFISVMKNNLEELKKLYQ